MTKAEIETTPQGRGGKQRRLRSIGNVRTLVADTLRAVEDEGSLGEPERAKIVLYGAKILAEIIKGVDLEERVRKLESKVAQ